MLYFLYWILLCYIVLISFILLYSNELYCTLSYFKCVVLYWTIILFYCTKHYQAVVYLSKRNYTKSLYFYVLFCAEFSKLYCTEIYCTELYCTMLYSSALYCNVLNFTVFNFTLLYCCSICSHIWIRLERPLFSNTQLAHSPLVFRLLWQYVRHPYLLSLCVCQICTTTLSWPLIDRIQTIRCEHNSLVDMI